MIPLDISEITDRLLIAGWLRAYHAEQIANIGVRLILSMHWVRPSKLLGEPPLELLWLPTFDNPLLPMSMKTICRGVEAALPVIERGDKVMVHCRSGRHRSVAMACCILVGMGYSVKDTIQLVKDRRSIADPTVWYIRNRIEKYANVLGQLEL